MGRLASLVEARSSLATPEQWLVDWFQGGAATPAGINVTEETALHYGPFFAGVRLIAEDVGSLPFPLYERLDPRGRRRATEHPLYRVVHDAPNPYMSSQIFREVLTGHAIIWGGGFAEIVTRRGVVTELWPLRPDRMRIRFDVKRRRLTYRYEDGVNGIYRTFLPDEILHVPGFGYDGVRGYSVLELARNSIGAGVAARDFGAAFFRNGARAGGVLTHPGVLSESARRNMRESWEKMHRGVDNAHRIAILEEGVTWQQIGIPPDDAQFLETRRFDVVEMARWLRLPPHLLGELDRATWNNIDSQQIDYVTKSLRIWLTRWEKAVWMRLLSADEQDRFFAEHIVDALLRGDPKTRFEAYRIGREIGLYSANDIAELENRNPLPDGRGDVYMVPLNWVPAPTPEQAADPARTAVVRHARTVESRRRIAAAFRPLLADVDERMARYERMRVLRLLRDRFGDRAGADDVEGFRRDVEELYEGDVLETTIDRWLPVLAALAAQVAIDASADIDPDVDPPDLESFVSDYTASHSAYRIGSAKRQILNLVDAWLTDTDALVDAVTAHLDEMVEVRPPRAGRWESQQMTNASARETWRSQGVTKLRWVAVGETCPYCTGLDGKIVGIEQPFVTAGDELDGPDGPLPIAKTSFHPPIHPGCDCHISPVV